MVSTGISDNDFEKLKEILKEIKCNWICIDVANGYMDKLVEFCKKVRDFFPRKIIVAGNVVTREMVEELILNGKVDICKIGIGSGSGCLTRMKTGVGMPQLSAIECLMRHMVLVDILYQMGVSLVLVIWQKYLELVLFRNGWW